MAVPVEKLPALLRTPFVIASVSKLKFVYPYHAFGGNNIRYLYKQKAPLIKYYNPHTRLELKFDSNATPHLEVFKGDSLIAELSNDRTPEELLSDLEKVAQESA